MKAVLLFVVSLLLLRTALLAQDCPNGVKKQVTFSIACGPEFAPEDLALMADAVVEVDVVAAHPHLGPRGGVMTRYDVEAVNVFKSPNGLQKGAKFSLEKIWRNVAGGLQVDGLFDE